MCHLNKGEVNDKRQCAAINCVCTVLGTVAHAVVAMTSGSPHVRNRVRIFSWYFFQYNEMVGNSFS